MSPESPTTNHGSPALSARRRVPGTECRADGPRSKVAGGRSKGHEIEYGVWSPGSGVRSLEPGVGELGSGVIGWQEADGDSDPRPRIAVVVFPGTNCDRDTVAAVESCGGRAEAVWHADERSLISYDAVILPGGFAHGDALRAGAIARFSPVMRRVIEFAETGRPVLGICNGFQVLLECGLLPGAMLRNDSLQFRAGWVHCRVEAETAFTAGVSLGTVLRMPIAHGEGNYVLPAGESEYVVALRYCDAAGEVTPEANPNGSADNIAGIARGNVFGLMPHPERACNSFLGSTDGRLIFESMLRTARVLSAECRVQHD